MYMRVLHIDATRQSGIEVGTPGLLEASLFPKIPRHASRSFDSGRKHSTVQKGTSGLVTGLQILSASAESTDGVYIGGVTPDGAGAKAAGAVLVRGMRIWSIDSKDVSHMTKAHVIEVLKKTEVNVLLEVEYDPRG